MSAFYGGRAEVNLRRTLAPVVQTDFASMYPTANALLGSRKLLAAETIEVVDATDATRDLLACIELADCYDPTQWEDFGALALVVPQCDLLPVRGRYSGNTTNIGLNYLSSDTAVWYALPDLIASKLLTGRAPIVLEAVRFEGRGVVDSLRSLDWDGVFQIDPREDDLFVRLVEARKTVQQATDLPHEVQKRVSTGLKIIANAGTYGIFAEMNEGTSRKNPRAYGLNGFRLEPGFCPEIPGEFCFPPIAAQATAGARLMLAMLQVEVERRGGSFVFTDTDSMAIIAAEHGGVLDCAGGPVQVLRWSEVEEIVEGFASLNPYSADLGMRSILKIEDENFGPDERQRPLFVWAISAKRYAMLVQEGERYVVLPDRCSQHGLGHLLNPIHPESDDRNWIAQFWQYLIDIELDQDPEPPSWLDQMALSKRSLTSPHLMELFSEWNRDRPWGDKMKPFNFILSAHIPPNGHPVGAEAERFHLFARYEPHPTKWSKLKWINLHTGEHVPVTTGPVQFRPNHAEVMTYRKVLNRYRFKAEPKKADQEGQPCSRQTIGLLRPLRLYAGTTIQYMGKESNRVDGVTFGEEHDIDAVAPVYRERFEDRWARAVPILRERFTHAQLAELLGISKDYVKKILAGRRSPRPYMRAMIELIAEAVA